MDSGNADPNWGIHAFDRGDPGSGPGGGSGSGPGGGSPGPGCLFGRRGFLLGTSDEEVARQPPLPGVAAVGLLIVVVCAALLWVLLR